MSLKISIAIALLGFLPLLIALWKRRRIHKLITEGDIVTGTVLAVYKRRGYKGSTYYQAIIEYPVFNHPPIQGSYVFSGKKALEVFYQGRKLEVYYDKNKPKKFIPKDRASGRALLIFGIVFAAVYLVLAYCLYNTMKEQGLS